MYLHLRHNENNFPSSLSDQFYYAIHSGNTIPQNMDLFDTNMLNWHYEYEFNRLKIQLLKSPYKTDCHDYDLSGKFMGEIVNYI